MPVIGIPVGTARDALGGSFRGSACCACSGRSAATSTASSFWRARCRACGFIVERAGTEEVPPAASGATRTFAQARRARRPADLEVVRMELLAVRPDLFDPGGLGRALRGYLGIETGPVGYPVGPAAVRLAGRRVRARPASLRPWIAARSSSRSRSTRTGSRSS